MMDKVINSQLLWDAPKIQRNVMDWKFTFNGWNLDNGSSVRVIQSNHDDIGTVQFDTYNTPLQDWWWVLWKYYRQKTIQFTLSVDGWSEQWLNDLIDEIKYQTSKTEWQLRIIINWVVREWTATCTSLKFNRNNYNVNLTNAQISHFISQNLEELRLEVLGEVVSLNIMSNLSTCMSWKKI